MVTLSPVSAVCLDLEGCSPERISCYWGMGRMLVPGWKRGWTVVGSSLRVSSCRSYTKGCQQCAPEVNLVWKALPG